MLSKVRRILDEACKRRNLPGAVLRVDHEGRTVHESAHGVTRYDGPAAMTTDAWFDLASLTKILGTTPAVMLLTQRGTIELEVGLGAYLPDLHPLLAEIPVYFFLNHTSGLADWHPFYQRIPQNLLGTVDAKDDMRQLLSRETLVATPGTVERYSDVGIGLIGFMVEAVSGQALPDFVAEQILAPLEIDRLHFGSIPRAMGCPWPPRRIVRGASASYAAKYRTKTPGRPAVAWGRPACSARPRAWPVCWRNIVWRCRGGDACFRKAPCGASCDATS